ESHIGFSVLLGTPAAPCRRRNALGGKPLLRGLVPGHIAAAGSCRSRSSPVWLDGVTLVVAGNRVSVFYGAAPLSRRNRAVAPSATDCHAGRYLCPADTGPARCFRGKHHYCESDTNRSRGSV